MPAAPGATPRKMLPPPMTMPISTPRRETWATSVTIASIVCRLIPYGSSPIRASPDSLRRIRLYLGVNSRRQFGAWLMEIFVDALAHHQECIAVHARFFRGEDFLHRLLVVLHEGLAEQGHLAEKLVER